MFCCVSRVASNYGVLDTDDGVIEWLDEATVRKYLQAGAVIRGFTLERGYEKIPAPVIPWTLCNWSGGQNIFQNGRVTRRNAAGDAEITCGKKKFKCKLFVSGATVNVFFSFNVQVAVPSNVFTGML